MSLAYFNVEHPPELGDDVLSSVGVIPNLHVSGVASVVGAERRQVQYAFETVRPGSAEIALVRQAPKTASFIGRDVDLDAFGEEPSQAVVDYATAIAKRARGFTFPSFGYAHLGLLFDCRYMEGAEDDEDHSHLPHLDYGAGPVPRLITLGSMVVGERGVDQTKAAHFWLGRYTWQGASQYDGDYSKYAEAAKSMARVSAANNVVYIGDSRTLIHAGPEEIVPRVVARAFVAPTLPYSEVNGDH